MLNLKTNCCDGIYNSLDVHFTSACDNKCKHCVDMRFNGMGVNKPNVDAIIKTVVENSEGVDDILFLGGEPCLYLNDLIRTVTAIKEQTKLKVFVTTAVPKVCYDQYDEFKYLISILDGLNLSVQHHDESIADKIRGTVSEYNRQEFYSSLPSKEKIRINLNLVRPYLDTKESITECLKHYDSMGFNSIKISEIQHGIEHYVSFEKLFGIKLSSPFSGGCQTYIDTEIISKDFKTPVLLKRSCFMCEETLKASFADGVKVVSKLFNKPNNRYGVVYGNGTMQKGWV